MGDDHALDELRDDFHRAAERRSDGDDHRADADQHAVAHARAGNRDAGKLEAQD